LLSALHEILKALHYFGAGMELGCSHGTCEVGRSDFAILSFDLISDKSGI
jgi:hypothetical protein